MAQAAILIYNAVNAFALKLGANALLASKIGHIAVTAAKVASLAIVSKLTTPTPQRPQGLMTVTDITADAPRRVQVGKRLNGGVFLDWVTKGDINEDTWRIFYLGEGPMGDITSIFADGRRVFSGTLTHGNEVTLTALDSRVRVRYYDGRPGQTADANLLASGVGWTSNHVGTGCAYCVVYARFHDTKLVVPPDMSFEVEGAKLYDRRQDSTAGGSGSQRLKDPSTWQLSTNPAVALDHYLLGRFLSGSDDEPWFGVGLDPSIVPYADFAAMANLCDEQVNLKVSGTQDRYSMNGFIFADEVFRDVIRRICDHMNARPADFGGLISVIDGESKAPVMTLDRSDAIDESAEVYKPKAPYSQIVGGVEGRYQDPANNYQPTDYPRYTEAAWKTQDGGETKYVTRDFEYEVNQERAERLASLFAKRSRRQATLSGVYPLKALKLEEGDWFTRTGGKFGAGKVFEVVGSPVLDVETMTVAVQSIEVDPTDSAWDETTAADQAASPDADPTAPALAVPSITPTAVNVSSGGVQIPGLRFEHTNYNADPPIVIEIEVAENDGSNGPEGDRQTMFMVREQQFGIMTGLLPSTGYVARWKGQIGELESAWSSWSPITTTSGYAVGSAASVPWSGVQDDGGRPDDNANVTGDHISAGITGQGPWATSGLPINDVTRELNDGLAFNPFFADPSYGTGVPPDWADWANGGLLVKRTRDAWSGTGVCVYGDATVPGRDNLGVLQQSQEVNPFTLYRMRTQWRRTGGSYAGAGMLIQWLDSSGNYISAVTLSCAHEAPIGGSTTVFHDGKPVWDKFVQPPSNARRVNIYAMWSWTGMPGYTATDANRFQGECHECNLLLASEPDRRTNTQEDGANVTGDHISAGISGQGPLATSALTESNADNTNQQWSDVGGAGRPDDNADVTGGNIAAGFTGQGGLATRDDVGTDQISEGAVTNTENDQDAAVTTPTNATWTDVASFSFTSDGIGVELRGSCEVNIFTDGTTPTAQFRLVRDSTVLKTSQVYPFVDAGFGFSRVQHSIFLDHNDLPSSGTYTYKLQANLNHGSGAVAVSNRDVSNRFLSAKEFKR